MRLSLGSGSLSICQFTCEIEASISTLEGFRNVRMLGNKYLMRIYYRIDDLFLVKLSSVNNLCKTVLNINSDLSLISYLNHRNTHFQTYLQRHKQQHSLLLCIKGIHFRLIQNANRNSQNFSLDHPHLSIQSSLITRHRPLYYLFLSTFSTVIKNNYPRLRNTVFHFFIQNCFFFTLFLMDDVVLHNFLLLL